MKKGTPLDRGITYIDLFAGAGGLSEGFLSAGCVPIAHVEMNEHACETLKTRACYYYLKGTNYLIKYYDYLKQKITREELYALVPDFILDSVICETMEDSNMSSIFSRIDSMMLRASIGKVDLVVGGPPCQAYSLAGRSRKCMDEDPRNTLHKHYFQVLEKFQPEMFVFENVPGLLTAGNGSHLLDIQCRFRSLDYELEYRIVDASDYGVLQKRKRFVLVGWKKNSKHSYPELLSVPNTFSINDILQDLSKVQAGESSDHYSDDKINHYLSMSNIRSKDDVLTWHVARKHIDRDREIYKKVIAKWSSGHQRLNYSDLPLELTTHKNKTGFLDRFKVVADDLPTSHTMMAHICKDGHYYIHPDLQQARSITVREAARIQSFPDNYYFEGPRTAAFMQIGNAVPPLMAKAIAAAIAKQFNGDKNDE